MAKRNLTITLRARNAMRKGLGKAKAALKSVGKTAKRIFGGLALGATAVTGALAGVVASTLKWNKELTQLQSRMGLSIEKTQEMVRLGEAFGAEASAIADAVKEAQMRLDEFAQTGAGPAAEAAERVGINMEEAGRLIKEPNKLIPELVRRMESLDTQAAKMRVADELFGGAGAEQLTNMITAGSDAMDDMSDHIERIGGTTEEQQEKMWEFTRAVNLLGQAWREMKKQISLQFLDELKNIVESLVKADLGKVGERIGKMVEGIVEAGGALFSEKGRKRLGDVLKASFDYGVAQLKVAGVYIGIQIGKAISDALPAMLKMGDKAAAEARKEAQQSRLNLAKTEAKATELALKRAYKEARKEGRGVIGSAGFGGGDTGGSAFGGPNESEMERAKRLQEDYLENAEYEKELYNKGETPADEYRERIAWLKNAWKEQQKVIDAVEAEEQAQKDAKKAAEKAAIKRAIAQGKAVKEREKARKKDLKAELKAVQKKRRANERLAKMNIKNVIQQQKEKAEQKKKDKEDWKDAKERSQKLKEKQERGIKLSKEDREWWEAASKVARAKKAVAGGKLQGREKELQNKIDNSNKVLGKIEKGINGIRKDNQELMTWN